MKISGRDHVLEREKKKIVCFNAFNKLEPWQPTIYVSMHFRPLRHRPMSISVVAVVVVAVVVVVLKAVFVLVVLFQ